jgi:hypothetical protein
MRKLELGDSVVIKNDLDIDSWYGTNDCVEEMVELRGQHALIVDVIQFPKKVEYHIDLDEHRWSWTSEMFE